ncbi:MAG: DNA starvation/stationary phase protection protein [Legionellaceae bacterium]|nr:DNA starvation/stationary phase protection protein [Legionellaceae bacterium]
MNEATQAMKALLADTYALYLKTQNYHWHVRGPQFKAVHELLENHYLELAEAIDNIAERIIIMGDNAPATFKEYDSLKTITDGDSSLSANEMVTSLAKDHNVLVRDLNKAITIAQENHDEGTVALLSERIAHHEKARWMLEASTKQ